MLKRIIGAAVIVAAVVPFAVFAQETTPEPQPEPIELPVVDPLDVSGDIITAGSSTVYPLSEAVAELFVEEGYSGQITIDSIGSGAGFERFCTTGETDISNASRRIRSSEVENCAAIGRTVLEFRVGTDALAVVVSAENDFLESLTLPQLSAIFTGAVTTWDQVDPSYPAQPIQLFSPGSDSGTFDYFVEAVIAPERGGNLGEEAEAAILNAPGIQFSEDDNVLVQGVEGSPYAIGYFGYAYYEENADLLRTIALDAGDGPIAPTEETAENNTYPISRPLFIYSAAEIFAEKPQVADFVNFYLTNVNDVIIAAGYFPASVEALNEAKQTWLDAMGM